MYKKERIMRAVVASSLVAALCAPATASAAFADEASGSKTETVYAKADAAGAVSGVYVVNTFDSGAAETVNDPANYTSVKNLATTSELVQTDGSVRLTTLANSPFSYQGNMGAATQLPWNVQISYWLDGKSITPEELAGQSGNLRVELTVSPSESAAEADDADDTEASGAEESGSTPSSTTNAGASAASSNADNVTDSDIATTPNSTTDFSSNYVVQAQGTFPDKNLQVTNTENVALARSGSNIVASCMVLPGESKTFAIEGEARDFEYSGWQITAMSLNMAVELSNEDTSELTDKTSDLENATSELATGASSLASGLNNLSSGSTGLAGATSQLKSGSASLASGIESAISNAAALAGKGSDLAAAWSGVRDGASGLATGTQALAAGSAQYEAALDQAISAAQEAGNVQAVAIIAQLKASYAEVSGGIDDLGTNAAALAEGAGAFDQVLSAYTENVDALAQGMEPLSAGATEALTGIDALSAGANSLATGSASAASGASELSSGANKLASATSGIGQEIIDGLQEAIDEKLGTDYTPHSFVAPENANVSEVQFVYVVDGVSVPDESDVDSTDNSANTGSSTSGDPANVDSETANDQEASILDRLLALFR